MREAYEALCLKRDSLYGQIERTCADIDRVVENPRGTLEEGEVERGVVILQAHLSVLHAQLDGILSTLERDHADDVTIAREDAREREMESRMLGTWDA